MTAHSTLHGHQIFFDSQDQRWRFKDTGLPTELTWRDRPCGHCGLRSTSEGHDGCLGTLPGVRNACCGHGNDRDAYVQFVGERQSLTGAEARRWQQSVADELEKGGDGG